MRVSRFCWSFVWVRLVLWSWLLLFSLVVVRIFLGRSSAVLLRLQSEECLPACLTQTTKHPLGAMVWGCMAWNGVVVNRPRVNRPRHTQSVASAEHIRRHSCNLKTNNSFSSCHRVGEIPALFVSKYLSVT